MRKTCKYWVGPISHPSDEASFTVGLMLYSTRFLTRYGNFDNTGVCDICQRCTEMEEQITVKPVLRGHSKKDKKLVFKTDFSLMQVKSIAECSKGPFCNTFDLH